MTLRSNRNAIFADLMRNYTKTLTPERAALLLQFSIQGIAFKAWEAWVHAVS